MRATQCNFLKLFIDSIDTSISAHNVCVYCTLYLLFTYSWCKWNEQKGKHTKIKQC